jgi:protein TonB
LSVFVICGLLFSTLLSCNFVNEQVTDPRTVCEEVFEVVEEMPELIGGLAGLHSRLEYPEESEQRGVEGRVTVEFVVNKIGTTNDLKIIRGVDIETNKEALRLVKTSIFDPGRMNGEETCVQMQLPVLFKLQN